ncbi:MAG TPA: BolA family protein [Bryobacteraceae bacterium]|nr:BolA family protein [Bryobacteraceae bacterium]
MPRAPRTKRRNPKARRIELNAAERITAIRAKLEQAFDPEELDIVDESRLHAGHPGARDGRGHFRVRLVSRRFAGTKPLQRHRMVYEALGELMQTDIHALSLFAFPPADAGHQER